MKKLLAILVGAMVLIGSTTQAAAESDNSIKALGARTYTRLSLVDSLAAIGDDQQIIQLIPKWLVEDDHAPEVIWPLIQRLGLAEQRLGHFEEALDHLERAILWAPRESNNHRNLATLLIRMGRGGRAFAEYREAAELAPGDWRIRTEYAHILMDYQQYEQAQDVLSEAADLCPQCLGVSRATARYYMATDQPRQALPSLELLVAADSTDSAMRDQFALVLLQSGEPSRARTLLLPEWQNELSVLGRRVVLEADRALGDSQRALKLAGLDLGVLAIGMDADIWALAALICHDANEDEAGLILVDRAISLNPASAVFRNNRVAFLFRLGRNEEAEAEYGVVIQLDPSLGDNRSESETVQKDK